MTEINTLSELWEHCTEDMQLVQINNGNGETSLRW